MSTNLVFGVFHVMTAVCFILLLYVHLFPPPHACHYVEIKSNKSEHQRIKEALVHEAFI